MYYIILVESTIHVKDLNNLIVVTFILNMILWEINGVHARRSSRTQQRVAESRGVVGPQRRAAPAQPLVRRRRAPQHATQSLPRLPARADAVAAHAFEPRVVL